MNFSLFVRNLAIKKWKFPSECKSEEDKKRFIASLPWGTSLITNNELKVFGNGINLENASQYREAALLNMNVFIQRWLEIKTTNSDLEKQWIYICHWIKLIEFEFKILFAIEPKPYYSNNSLPEKKCIELWEKAYNTWNAEFESRIFALDPNFTSPNFVMLFEAESKKRQEELDKFLYWTPRYKADNNCSNGEEEFWRAVNNGDLDSIGF